MRIRIGGHVAAEYRPEDPPRYNFRLMRGVGVRATMQTMTSSSSAPGIEPLFAYNARLWLRVWATTQYVAIVLASLATLVRAGGVHAYLATHSLWRALLVISLLVVYHTLGMRAHRWIMRRPLTVIVFVPLGWILILSALSVGGDFGLLVLGAIIQGFIFLPFSWAIATLTMVIALVLSMIGSRTTRQSASLTIAQAGGTIAMGIMIGTVMLYIHRANRDNAVRAQLLEQLDEAQRDLAERAKETGVQQERQRLAHDIHDTLAQGFSSVIRHLEAIELSFSSANSAAEVMQNAQPHLAHAQAVSRSSLAEIRRLLWALRPPQLAGSTLAAALERLVAQWSEANGVAATCTIDELPPLHADADIVFLRAAQEALSNVARHAHATRVSITMHCLDDVVLLSVEDDGRGLVEADTVAAGKVGIAGMRERVRRFGGHVMIESTATSGTSLTVALPLAAIASGPGLAT